MVLGDPMKELSNHQKGSQTHMLRITVLESSRGPTGEGHGHEIRMQNLKEVAGFFFQFFTSQPFHPQYKTYKETEKHDPVKRTKLINSKIKAERPAMEFKIIAIKLLNELKETRDRKQMNPESNA